MSRAIISIRGEGLTLVSVAVCVRNGIEWIDGCLDSLVNQSHSPIEIILVDDGSSDGSQDKVKEWSEHELVTVINQSAIGLSAGRMAALDVANGDWFAITDIDVRPEKDWIERMLEVSNSREGEEIVAVTGRTVFGQADDVISRIRSVEIESKYRSRPRSTKLANGPCSMFVTEKLRSIGGFDPSWYHAEDMEVSLKLIQTGGTIVYTPNAVVNHIPETGLGRFLHKRRRDARAHVRIHRRYRGVKHDFIGSSWIVLWMVPLLVLGAIGAAQYIINLLSYDEINIDTAYYSLSREVLLVSLLPLFWTSSFLRCHLPKNGIKPLVVLISWSVTLWLGIAQGYFDALLRRKGH